MKAYTASLKFINVAESVGRLVGPSFGCISQVDREKDFRRKKRMRHNGKSKRADDEIRLLEIAAAGRGGDAIIGCGRC